MVGLNSAKKAIAPYILAVAQAIAPTTGVTLAVTAATTQLVACGGGDNTNTTPSVPNTPPVPTTTTLSTDINQFAQFTLGATDVNNDLLTFAIATQATHGIITTTSSGVATYTPNIGYVGIDTFTYTVKDPTNTAVSQTVSVNINKLVAPSAPTLTADDFNHLVFPTGKTASDYEVSTNSGASWSPAVATAYAAGTYQIRLIETENTSAGLPQTLTITTANVVSTIPTTVDAAGFIGQFDFTPYLQSGWTVVVEGSTTIPNSSLVFNTPIPNPRPLFSAFVDLNATKVDVYEPTGALSGISFNVPTKFRFQNASGKQSDVINILFNNVTTQ